MICCVESHSLLKPAEGNSGAIPFCATTSAGFLLGCKMTKKEQREYNKKYYQAHKIELKAKSKEYYIATDKAKRQRLRISKPELVHRKEKAFRKKYKSKLSVRFKTYYQANKDKFRLYEKEKAKTNLGYRLAKNLRCRIWHAISRKWVKSERTSELVGCSLLELRAHLEKQFQCGMSWDNYGKWHIDHIKPYIKFDLTKLAERQQCFHYSNLQPLWAAENLAKGGR